jgi:hydrogenase maturation protease
VQVRRLGISRETGFTGLSPDRDSGGTWRNKEQNTDQQRTTLIGYLGNPPAAAEQCIGHLIGQQLEKEYAGNKDAVVKELVGSPLQIIMEISNYSDVLLIDEVLAGQEVGEILIFDVNDMCDHLATLYLHGMNLSEAVSSGKQMGLPIPGHFLLAGIEIGGDDSPGRKDMDKESPFPGSISVLLQEKMNVIFQTIRSIIADFLNHIL